MSVRALALVSLSLVVCGCSCHNAVNPGDGGMGGGGGGNDDGGGGSCTPGQARSCGTDVGSCVAGQQTCDATGAWGACAGEVGPAATEACDGLDNTCNGVVDEGCTCTTGAMQQCGANVGQCRAGTQTCAAGAWGACTGAVDPVAESCNGLDDDCDAMTDEGCSCVDGAMQGCGTDVGECTAGMQTCTAGAWGACAGQVLPAAERCNGLDDDCDGMSDEGCDDDLDGHCDAAMTVVGTPAVCPNSPANTADDCNDGSAVVKPGATERCNDADDNCAAGADEGCDDDGDDHCDAMMTVVGTPAVCPLSPANTADDCNDADAAIKPGATETCNGLDENCAGIDEGCDDDGDDYCDAAMTVVGTPAVCPLSPANTGDDCNDMNAAVKPGATEICTDGLDNNCDRRTDLLDTVACPPITVDIVTFFDPIDVAHGRTTNLFANIMPPDPAMMWPRVWSVIDAQPAGTCTTADIGLSAQMNAAGSTSITVTMPNTFAKKDCIYTVQVAVNGYAKDLARVRMVNRLPTLSIGSGAVFDGVDWRLQAVAGSTPSIQASAFDSDNDSPLGFNWGGADVARLSCAPNCVTSDAMAPYQATVTWAAPATPGAWRLTVLVNDGFDPTPAQVTLIVDVDTCVWARSGGAGTGATPGSPLGTIAAALSLAAASPMTSVCVIGSGVFPENLVLPAAPNTPDLLGGFGDGGVPLASQRPVVEVSVASGVTFAPGHAGTVRHLGFRQAADAGLSSVATAIVTVQDSSPQLIDVAVTVGLGTAPSGIVVGDDSAVSAATAPLVAGSAVNATMTSGPDATGIRAERTTGMGPQLTVRNSTVNMFGLSCPSLCRGVHLFKTQSGTVSDNSNVFVNATTGSVVGIDLAGVAGMPVSANIVDNSNVSAGTQNGPLSVALRLSNATRVNITDNNQVGSPFGAAGRAFSAGIADGMVTKAGVVTQGGSSFITVSRNATMGPGSSFWAQPCTAPGNTGEGADVVAGAFFAGTTDLTFSNNGTPGSMFAAVFGGGSTVQWTPATRRLVPSAVGLWLVDTLNARVTANELRSGGYATMMGCPLPSENPAAIGFRDGLPPNPAFGGGTPGSMPSRGTQLDRNGVSCARPPENGGIGNPTLTWCVAAELNAAASATAPQLTNNYLAATKGNFLIGLRMRGGGGVVVANNTIDADLMLEPFDPPPPAGTIMKWPVLLERIDTAGIALTNNIFYAHRDDPYDNVAQRLVVREESASGTASRISTLRSNLFYIEGDNLLVPAAPYVRVTDGAATANYASNQLNMVMGVGMSAANFAALPGIVEVTRDSLKSTSRLLPGSAAIDVGQPVGAGVPNHDIDNDTRPRGGGVDVGHDER